MERREGIHVRFIPREFNKTWRANVIEGGKHKARVMKWWDSDEMFDMEEKNTTQSNKVKLLPSIYPSVWAAAPLTAETEGVLLCVCVHLTYLGV